MTPNFRMGFKLSGTDAHIYLAFRFHGNFYHSYRGDTPDELGFGKDIRILRHILQTLDDLNACGIPVCGTWDFENLFSLQEIIPAHSPDLLAALQRRAQQGHDEFHLMSYNNGLVSAHDAREFEAAIRRGISNPQGSGLRDLFGDAFYPMVRPQEMMFTPVHLQLYPACGIHAISLFYSALPFNGFSNFLPLLSAHQRYNPLTLTYPGLAHTMTLMPCYNTGDLADHLTLRRWVKQMRRAQLQMEQPHDLLLLIDMDADDEFWAGFDIPLLKGRFSTISGLRGLVENVADLEYVRFTTPGRYLETHPPLQTVIIGQDTADGSFDGLSSWAEKWSNHQVWTLLERARLREWQTCHLSGNSPPASIQQLLNESFETRLRLLSTTHFGMSAPIMNRAREQTAFALAHHALKTAEQAFAQSAQPPSHATFCLFDYPRGLSTEHVLYETHPSKGLIRLRLDDAVSEPFALRTLMGIPIPSAVWNRELFFVDRFAPGEMRMYHIEAGRPPHLPARPVRANQESLENEFLCLTFDLQGHPVHFTRNGEEFATGHFLRSGVTYAGQTYQVTRWETVESKAPGIVGWVRQTGRLTLKGGHPVEYQRELLLAAGLPYLYVSMRVTYPPTPHAGYSKEKARRLGRTWDSRWQEVRPCEIHPALFGALRVWKHNYFGHVSTYALDYGRFSSNRVLDSVNNHVTCGWVAVSDGMRGLLTAYTVDTLGGMAFCPMRTRADQTGLRVAMNPFGSYWGRQYRYDTADTGLGRFLAIALSAADHINPYAPSYNGQRQQFQLLLAPYSGDAPPVEVQKDALAFAYPYGHLEQAGHTSTTNTSTAII
ncbi:MAG: hypothetical protein N2117_01630 [Anaerolineales bacterium]|nr:hypothetical protein [Anaerolineales bacterium]MCX7753933.1 hypothetical protein [Anaerolineales bacterium]MDW8278012.1 hypothetical protein [Anaerolineales bacterium]